MYFNHLALKWSGVLLLLLFIYLIFLQSNSTVPTLALMAFAWPSRVVVLT